MATLTLARSGQIIWSHRLEGHCNRIGRDPSADIVLPDAEVSRIHAILYETEQTHRLVDNSTNGTLINGHQRRVARLHTADVITIGPYQMTYEQEAVSADLPATVPSSRAAPVVGYQATTGRFLTEQDVLIVRDQGREPTAYILGAYTRIGTDASCDLRLQLPDEVQCDLRREGRRYRLTAQRGEVILDGTPTRSALIKSGVSFQLGDTLLELASEEGEEEIRPMPLTSYAGMVGSSEVMGRLFTMIERVAPLSAPVMVLGETGVGKELVARALHSRSPRARGPFVAVNCGAINRDLAESELFGHERGAFTGATQRRDGAFQSADGGTLFLDEVGELPPELQVKLLRALETQRITRVGSSAADHVEVRVVAATHRDLSQEVQLGRFRQDLFFRLFVIPIEVPPLRARTQDIPLLATHFFDELAQARSLSPEALAMLRAHEWPGNVRELRHLLTRAVALTDDPQLEPRHLDLAPIPGVLPLDTGLPAALLTLEEMERRLIERALRTCKSRRDAADVLGIARSTLHLKMKKYDLA